MNASRAIGDQPAAGTTSGRAWLCLVAWLLTGGAAVAQTEELRIREFALEPSGRLVLRYDAVAGARYVLLQGDSVTAITRPVATNLAPVSGTAQFVHTLDPNATASFYRIARAATGAPKLILEPAPGSRDVGVTVRPKIHFPTPVALSSLDQRSLRAEAGGTPLATTLVPARDGSFVWLFFDRPMPGGALIRLTVDGALIRTAGGAALDADGDGIPGGVAEFTFGTVSVAPIPGTALVGRLVDPGPDLRPMTADDVVPGQDGVLHTADDQFLLPIQGARVFLLGVDHPGTVTDATGYFRLQDLPAGEVKIVTDGRTAVGAPAGYYFPEMVSSTRVQAAATNFIMAGMETMYLPRLASNILQTVDASQPAVVTLPPSGAYDLPEADQRWLRLEVPAQSLVDARGAPVASAAIGISVVPPELVADMLPPGLLQHTFDITVQALGVERFSTPAPMTFPNVFRAPPGTRLNFLSFDHMTGRLVIEGTATVAPDGLSVRTDPGTGITHPGWHGLTPPGVTAGGPDPCPEPDADDDDDQPCEEQVDHTFISDREGGQKLDGYVPNAGGSMSGVTVGTGIDLGQRSAAEINALPISDALKTKLAPYAGLTGQAAVDYLTEHPLNLTQEEADDLDDAVRGPLLEDLIRRYNEDSAVPFCELPPEAQTVIASVGYQYGANLEAEAPNFWRQVTSQQWQQAIDNLRNFGDDYPTRRGLEADLLENVLDDEPPEPEPPPAEPTNCGGGEVHGPPLPPAGAAEGPAPRTQFARRLQAIREAAVRQSGRHHVAIFNLETGEFEFRGAADGGVALNAPVFLAANSRYRVLVLQPGTLWSGYADFITPESGRDIGLPRIRIGRRFGEDADGDGLSNQAELILGSHPRKFSTSGDGVSDGAKFAQNLDPLAGRPTTLGLLATLPLPGEARAVALAGSVLNPAQQRAYVALGDAGLGIVDVSQPQALLLLDRLDLDGDSGDVAVATELGLVLVAAGSGGLALVAISDAAAPQLRHVFPVAATQVEVIGPVAYAAVGSRLGAFDVLARQPLASLSLGPDPITGLASDGLTVFTMDSAGVCRAIGVGSGAMVAAGAITLNQAGGRLFAARGIVYAGSGSSRTGGFATVDFSDPDQPRLLSDVDAPNIQGAALALNGSGLVLTAGTLPGLAGERVSSLDVLAANDPSNTGDFLRRVVLAGTPSSVAIGGGIAFVAAGGAGLHAVSYRAYDDQAIPPTIRLTNNFATLSLTNGLAEEAKLFHAAALVADDFQVRAVEFFVDGVLAATDVAFPFEHRWITPLASRQARFRVQARAMDTGGKASWSEERWFDLTADATPPRVVRVSPQPGAWVSGTRAAVVSWNEPMRPSTLSANTLRVLAPGPDGLFDTADDVALGGGAIRYLPESATGLIEFPSALAPGAYRAVVARDAVDLAGNAMAAPVTWGFVVANTLETGQTFQGRLPAAGDNLLFTLTAAPGDVMRLRMSRAADSDVDPHLEAFDAAGRRLGQAFTFGSDVTLDVQLASGGDLFVRASDAAGDDSGSFSLGMQRLNTPPGVPVLDLGQRLGDSIGVPGQMKAYTFTGQGGDAVRVRMSRGLDSAVDPQIEVFDSTGQSLGRSFTFGSEVALDVRLISGGQALVLVTDAAGEDTGAYSLALQRLNIPAGVPILALGQTVNTTIDLPGQMKALAFAAQSGDAVRVRMSRGLDSPVDPQIEVLDSTGRSLGSSFTFGSEVALDVQLTNGGQALVLVTDAGGEDTGTFSLALHQLNTPAGVPTLDLNQTVPATLDLPGQLKAFGLDATPGDALRVRMRRAEGSTIDPAVEVFDRTGMRLAATSTFSDEASVEFVASADGPFLVLVSDAAGDETGAFTVSAERVGP
jgi:hypothetical protein